ncbi:ABI family, member 3 (NESH) binding protein, transcript variant X11 [Columba livia]|uniref:ABI family, member 3 (NESH) binding protein, transcript variant X11 n=1 Tax=Columba livia TaxID=8932 RepID=A0A2I0MT15_COLLI|nr:ABI family, member 3 (NESH) binding protein, transcript variant X11 [Columba livia]
MMSRLVFLLFCGYIALNLGNAQKLPRVKRQSLKVQINATDDTVCMRYLRPSQNTKLEGFVLGYGSNFFSNQYVPLPSEGNTYVTELDAEPRYLVSVRPARISNNKKSCSGRNKTQKPLQLVVGTLTPTSVFLSWGILVNPQHDWTATNNCASDRFYTVRYREKDKDKKWVFQLCPVTETVVDNLKPNTVYEFGVKDNVEDSIWSKTSNHKIVLSNKKVNGHLQNMYKLVPNAQTQLTLRDNKKLVPVTIIKQVIQNRTQSKTADSSSLPGAILVHLIVPGLNETQQKLPPLLPIDDRPQASRKKLAKNESRVWPAESKTPEVQEISPQTLPAQAEKKYGPEEFKSTPKPELVRTQNNLASNEIQPLPSGSRISDAPKSLLTEFATWSPGLKLVSLPSTEATEMEMAFEETQPVSSGSKTSATTEVQPTRSASHDFLHVTSTPQTFTASEIPDTASDTTELKISTPIITTESQLSGTALDLGERKPLSSRSTTSGMPEMPPVSAASQKPGLESTSWTSPETTRPAMATRRPRLKSTTPSSLPTQQTVMASHDFLDVTSTPQTSTSAKISERETVIIQAPFKPASSNNIEEEPATDETPPVSSRPTMFPIPEMPSTKSATQRPGLKFTSHPSIETRGSVMAFDEKQDISLGSETPDIQEMPLTVPASQKPGLESTSWTSPETTRPAMATRRPRLKSTTPSSLPTQQTVMASLDSHHITVRFQTSASAEISKIETVTSSADLEKSVPSLSRTPHVLTTTTAFGGIQPVLSSPVTPSKPEIADAGRATSESILESFTPKTSRAFQWPRVTLAPKEIPLIPSKLKPSASPEVQHVKPAPKPPLLEPKISQMLEQPKATLAPKEAKLTPSASKPRPSARPKKPRTKPVLEPITLRIEPPRSTIAPKESQRVPSKPRTSTKPHIPQVKDVLESITRRTDQLKPTIVPKEIQRVPSKPRTPPISEVPQTKPVLEPITFGTEKPKSTAAPKDTHLVPSKPKTSPSPRVPPTRASPKESRRVPSKPRASPSPDVPHTKPAPKEPQYAPFRPKAPPIPDAPHRKPEIIPTFHEPETTMIPHIPERTKATLAPTEKQFVHTKPKTTEKPRVPHTKPAVHQTTPLPIITKSSTTTQRSRATMAPKETLLIPSKPKTSVMPEVPQTKPAPRATHLGSINLITVHVVDGSKVTLVPNETYQISPKPKTALATEIPRFHTAPHKTRHTSPRPKPSDKSQTRPALSKTTLAPPRTKAPGLPKWIVPTADEVYTPEDIAREIGMDVKKPLEYSHTWEKPFAVTTSPGPRHPPVPPVKPTQMRRKPLPPNTVTGKPGSPAKPAGPTTPVRTGTSYKTPTAFATPEYYVDATVFSSSPTSETDSSGKPRYQAPHVKYMKKDDDVPCSITSSLEHFPQEEAGSKEEPTRPPQNPPTNLTVVTVEGCPTFVILDWEKPDNDTVTEYEVVSTENGASDGEKEKSITTTNQTHSTVENLKPDTSYEFHVKPRNPLGEGPSSNVVQFSTESADPRVSEPISMGKDAIWTEIPFDSDSYSECKGKQYVKRTWYKKFVGVQLCNSLRYKIYLSDSLTGKFYNIGDQRGHGEDHCQFVDSFLDGRTGQQEDLPVKDGFFRAVRQEPVKFGKIGGETQINYVRWYECGTSIPGKW